MISARGLCHECGMAALAANMYQLNAHSGPYFDHWRRRTLAAFGIFLPLDETPHDAQTPA